MKTSKSRYVEGGKRRKGFNNKKEVPSSCPELLNGATLTKSTAGAKQLKMLSAINLFASLSLYHPSFQKNGFLLIFSTQNGP